MKRLPKIYHTIINTQNNKKCFYSKNDTKEYINENTAIDRKSNTNIKEKINDLLKNNVMYSKEVTIILKDTRIKTRIIRKYDNYILTIDNNKINYNDIIDIIE